jgi:type III secretion protein R
MSKIVMWFSFVVLLISPLIAQEAPAPITAQAEQAIQIPIDETTSANPNMITKLAVLAGLSLLPFAIMLMTSFVKIVVVLSLLRNAIGVQQTPPNQVLNGIALLVTIYVMFPTGLAMYNAAEEVIQKQNPTEVLSGQNAAYIINIVDKAKEPLRVF